MSGPIAPFAERYRKALTDGQLGRNLLNFQRAYGAARRAAFEHWHAQAPLGIPAASFAGQRELLTRAKSQAVRDHVKELARFRTAAEAAGATVYESTSARDAVRYVVELCQRRGARLVAKGKSMVSEELFLNQALEAAGVTAIETDLGEWIVQLAHETPSHMVMPAIHKSRQQVGELFEAHVGRPVSREDIAEMAGVARQELRRVFADGRGRHHRRQRADRRDGHRHAGHERGQRPAGHLVLAPDPRRPRRLREAGPDLGRRHGAAPAARAVRHRRRTSPSTRPSSRGPDRPGHELHIVIVDNGRSEMAADPDFEAALRCIRCAACADVCPPYQVVGGHAFGLRLLRRHRARQHAVPPRPRGRRRSRSRCASRAMPAPPSAPSSIPLPRHILDVRHRVAERLGLPLAKAGGPRGLGAPARSSTGLAMAARPRAAASRSSAGGSCGSRSRRRGGGARRPRWRGGRRAPRLLGRELAPAARGPLAQSGARGLTVAYFVQCLTDRFAPEQAAAAVRVLRACGARVVVPEGQHCCGLPALDAGDRASARAMARQTIAVLEAAGADWIVTAAASCAVALVHDYGELFRDDAAWRRRAEALAARTLDLVSFLEQVAKPPAGALARPVSGDRHTYHSFCHSTNVLGIAASAPRLLREVCGLEVTDLPEGEVCCGFGGSTSLDHPEVARAIVTRKLDNVAQTGATVLVTDNPGCLLHLRGAADAQGLRLRVAHVAEILAEGLRHDG